MADPNTLILETAARYLGVREHSAPGASNPAVESFWTLAGMERQKDEVPWCAAFVGAVLGEVGLPNTGRPNARSYEKWGRKVSLAEARPGDVVVLSRGTQPWQGHVGFLVRFDGDRVVLRGGNQSDAVSDAPYSVSRIVAIRRADAAAAAPVETRFSRRTLVRSYRGEDVRELQKRLAELRFFPGRADGIFGPRTHVAVVAFQTAAGLEPDGVVGRLTWAALLRDDAPSMPGRDVSADTLRKEGSRTVAAADRIAEAASGTAGAATVAGVAGAVGTVGTAISGAVDVAADAGEQLSGLDATALVVVGVIMLVVVVAAVVVFANARRQKIEADRVIQARVDDARSGANLGR
jgi:uncharacterized protein (TIGR02594 family)